MTVLREFFIRVGAQVDKSAIKGIKTSISDIGKGAAIAAGSIGAFIAAGYGIKNLVSSVASVGDKLLTTSKNLHIGSDELQKFQYAGNMMGASNELIANSLKFLNKNMAEAAKGGGAGKEAFDKLGVSVKDGSGKLKTASDLFPEIADNLKKLKDSEKINAMMKIFGRSGADLGEMMGNGSKGIDEMFQRFKKLNLVISKENLEAMDEFNDKMYETDSIVFKLKSSVISALLPVMNKMADSFGGKVAKAIQWVEKNQSKLTAGFEKFIKIAKYAALAGVVFGLGKMGVAIGALVAKFAALGVAGTLAWAKTLAGPLLLGGAIAAVSLLIEDLWKTYMNPEARTFTRKLLHDWENRFPKSLNAIKAIINSIRVSLAGWGLIWSKMFGTPEQQKIWEDMIKEYGGRVISSTKKATGGDLKKSSKYSGPMSGALAGTLKSWEVARWKNPDYVLPGAPSKAMKEYNPSFAAFAEAIDFIRSKSDLESFAGMANYPPDVPGRNIIIQNVNINPNSPYVNDLADNLEAATSRIK